VDPPGVEPGSRVTLNFKGITCFFWELLVLRPRGKSIFALHHSVYFKALSSRFVTQPRLREQGRKHCRLLPLRLHDQRTRWTIQGLQCCHLHVLVFQGNHAYMPSISNRYLSIPFGPILRKNDCRLRAKHKTNHFPAPAPDAALVGVPCVNKVHSAASADLPAITY